MKKILFVFLLSMFPMTAFADNIYLDCPSKVTAESTFSCELIGNTSNKIMSLKATVTTDDNLSFVGFIPANNWQGDGVNGSITLYTADDLTDKFNIGTIKFENTKNGNGIITIDEVFFYSDEDTIPIDSLTKEINVVNSSSSNSNDPSNEIVTETISSTYLADIIISGYDIEFQKEKFDYTLLIGDETELVIEPLLEDNSSTLEIKNNKNLKNGSSVLIVITAEDNTSSTYTINILKDEKEANSQKNYSLIFIIIISILVIINLLRIALKKKNDGDKK